MNVKSSNVRVLFVCMGNICRSPSAEGVFRHKVEEAGLDDAIHIDSAGTHAYHVGEPPDPRATEAARRRGIDLTALRARKARARDFDEFDYVLAMDRDNLRMLEALRDSSDSAQLHLFLDFARSFRESEVPDPYYGGDQGFEHVLDLIEDASEGLLDHIRREHALGAESGRTPKDRAGSA